MRRSSGGATEQLLDPRLRDIPIVVVTANANLSQTEDELKTTGAMRKPVSLKQLFKVAELHCGKPDMQRRDCRHHRMPVAVVRRFTGVGDLDGDGGPDVAAVGHIGDDG